MFSSSGSGLALWQAQLNDRPTSLPMLPFATQGFRNPDAIPAFHHFELDISAELSMNIRLTCTNNGHTENQFGLAALQILLMQLTGTDDFVIGIGRTVGDKSDTMPVRFRSGLDKSFQQLLERTEATLRSARQYSHVTVEELLSALDVSRQTLLHQVTYGWLAKSMDPSHDTEVYFQHAQDLVLIVREDSKRNLRVFVAVQEVLYEKEHAGLIAELYEKLLSSLATGIDADIRDMDVFEPQMREKFKELGAGPHIKPSAESILIQISEVTEKVPDRLAAKDQYGNQVTYIQLVRRAVAISTALRAHDVTNGTPVCVLGSPTTDMLCAILGIWCACGIYVPVNHHDSAEHNTTILGQCGTNICIISTPDLMPYARSIGLSTILSCSDLQFIEGIETFDEAVPDDVAVGLHVSASSGIPKGIMLTHGNLMTLVVAAKYYFETESPIVLQHTHWTHDLALFQILFALTSGGTLLLAPASGDSMDMPNLLKQQNVTVTVATPSEYMTWFRADSDALSNCSSWKFAFCGGENMTSSIIRNFATLENSNLELVNMYGATESSGACCMGVVDYHEYAADQEGKLIPVGPALPNNHVWITDKAGRPVPPGWTGEVCVGGSGISSGYFGPDVDDDMFCTDARTGAEFFRPGDHGFMNDRGVLFVVSRRQDHSVVQLRGYSIELNDISRTIINKSDGKVAEAAVVLTDEDEPQVQAFVVMSKASNAESPRYLQAMLRSLNLPAYTRPTRAVILEAFPLTPAGKTDRHALQTMEVPSHRIIYIVQPASSFGRSQHPVRGSLLGSTEQKILEMWKECLPRAAVTDKITATTDFFALGGTTSSLSHVLSKMRPAFRNTLTIVDLAQNATLRGMTTVALNKMSIFTLGGTWIDWKSETALPMTKGPDFSAEAVRKGQALVVLLTGGTGFLGRAVLECLVKAPEVALIHCVALRSSEKAMPHSKILWHRGDVTQHNLGLSDSDWKQLSRSVDVIMHAAALVDCIHPYSSLRSTNVLGTKKLIQFAAPRLIPIHYVSSASVGRFVGHATFPEMAVAGHSPPDDADGYTASKWASEAVLEKAHSKLGVPVMIHRPTSIIGPNAPSHDIVTKLFHYARELRAAPSLDVQGALDMIPIEVVARTMVREVLQPIRGINFSNMGCVRRVPVRDLHLAMAMDTGVEMRKVQLQEWVRLAKGVGMSAEVAHLFEEFDELVKLFVHAEVHRSRDLA